jgi:hypothetical protein
MLFAIAVKRIHFGDCERLAEREVGMVYDQIIYLHII